MPRRKKQSEGQGRKVRPATSDNIYSVNLLATPKCLKAVLSREKLKFLKIGCGCRQCAPGPTLEPGTTGRPRPTADELFADACCEPTPNADHVRRILQGAQAAEYTLRLLRRGLMNALARGRLSFDDRMRASRLLDYFDVDGERRRRERREMLDAQRKQVLDAATNSELSQGEPGGPYPS